MSSSAGIFVSALKRLLHLSELHGLFRESTAGSHWGRFGICSAIGRTGGTWYRFVVDVRATLATLTTAMALGYVKVDT